MGKAEEKAIVDMTLQHAQKKLPCILCKRPTHNRGIFFPENSQDFGAAPGKFRTIVYAICLKHPKNNKTMQQTEEILLREFGNGR